MNATKQDSEKFVRCDHRHNFIAKHSGNVYEDMQCARPLGHKGACKWSGIRYDWCQK